MNPPTGSSDQFPEIYEELRRIASQKLATEKREHTLSATALVHEAYLKLIGSTKYENPSHFYRTAALAMQQILVDHARRKKAQKRGGKLSRQPIVDDQMEFSTDPDTLLAIDDALRILESEDPTTAEVARLRLFTGLSVEEAGDNLGMSRATAFREWSYAKAFLVAKLQQEE